MHSAEVVLGYLLAQWRNTAGDCATNEYEAALKHAVSQLGVLSSSAAQHGRAGDMVAEVYVKAREFLNSKQAGVRKQGLEMLASIIPYCDRRTFLSSQLEWFTALVSLLRSEQPADVHHAAWTCLAALFSRLHRMLDIPGVRRDGATMVPKLMALLQQKYFPQQQASGPQPAASPTSPAVPEYAALRAILAATTALPAPFRQHLKYLEPLLCGTLMQPLLPAGTVRLAAGCVASLPRIEGDGASWSAMTQRLLLTAHVLLDTLIQGLDDQGVVRTARELLDPQATTLPNLPSPSSTSLPEYKAAFAQLEATVEALQSMLTASYPSPVPLPSMSVLLLVARLLEVDDASGGAGRAGSSKFAELCLRLPAMHAMALRLLCTLLDTAGAQLAPLYLTTATLLGGYLERVSSGGAGALTPSSLVVRCQLYAAVKALLQSAGVGVVRVLAAAILKCARSELYGSFASGENGGKDTLEGIVQRQPAKKRKKSKGQGGAEAEGSLLGGEVSDDAGSVAARLNLSAQVGMLGVLEVLLTSGAALMTPHDRTQADAMAAHMSSSTAAAVQKLSQDADGDTSPLARLQLAAYRALLAAVLAPADHRPIYIPLALRLFRAGLRGSSPSLAAWCSKALLGCEAMIHPRSIPHPLPLRPSAFLTAGGAPGLGMLPSAGFLGVGALDGEDRSANGGQLGKPAFWSYLDGAANAASMPAAAVDAGGVPVLTQQNQEQEQVRKEKVPQQPVEAERPKQQQQQHEKDDVVMTEALPVGQLPRLSRPDQHAAPAVPAQLGVNASASALPAQKQLSSMATMMIGRAANDTTAAPAIPSIAVPAAKLPFPAEEAAVAPAMPSLQQADAGVLQPVEPAPVFGSRNSLLVACREESDSDGPLPEIDSGDEESSSDEEEAESDA